VTPWFAKFDIERYIHRPFDFIQILEDAKLFEGRFYSDGSYTSPAKMYQTVALEVTATVN
jgi:hypothetical protein